MALILLGRAKPVRAIGRFAQQAWENFPGLRPWLARQPEPVLPVERRAATLYQRPGIIRRLGALLGTTVLGIAMGVVIAVIVGAAAIWFVGSVTGRLK